jgi:hypothetical protein
MEALLIGVFNPSFSSSIVVHPQFHNSIMARKCRTAAVEKYNPRFGALIQSHLSPTMTADGRAVKTSPTNFTKKVSRHEC